MNLTPSAPLSQFPTVTKSLLPRLNRLGLKIARDLLFYFPFRYDDFRAIAPIAQIQPGQRLTVRGRLQLIANKRSFHRHRLITEAVMADETGQLKVVWFNQPYLIKILKAGDLLSLAGKAVMDHFGLQMINPVFEKVKDGQEATHTGRLAPIYPATEGLTQKQLRFLIKRGLAAAYGLKDWLPKEIIRANQFFSLPVSLKEIHFPSDEKKLKKAGERFQFEELFLIQLRNEMTRQEFKNSRAPIVAFKEKETKEFVVGLPFELTRDQRQAAWEILKDIGQGQPMNRLLDGDVGCGKTVVAAIAVHNAVLNGYQAVLMAPTEILAFQHYNSFCKLFADSGVTIGLATGSVKKVNQESGIMNHEASKKESNKKISDSLFIIHNSNFVVGTHALIEDSVQFHRLGLAIVDEQHRFGVEQRKKLRGKSGAAGLTPHFLSMTATPIPRSLSLAVYGDLDLSLIKEMPKERKKIITRLVDEINRPKAYEFIRQQVKAGRQTFVVCPLIEESRIKNQESRIEKKSVLREYERLSKEVFPDLKIGNLHGRMKSNEKEKIMKDFLEKKFDILVSTSVVEVGVDVINASVMMIEGAERFGLAQLHQFRGRVGRSEHQSYCLLFTNCLSEAVKQRLAYFVASRDGFELAEKDLELRGPGEIFGTTQHGFPELKIANLRDIDLIKKSREAAKGLLANDPSLTHHSAVRERLAEWEKEVHLE